MDARTIIAMPMSCKESARSIATSPLSMRRATLQNDSSPTSCSSGISATRFRCPSSRNWSNHHHMSSEYAILASRLEDDSMSYDVFSPILYYANLAPASGEDLLEMA